MPTLDEKTTQELLTDLKTRLQGLLVPVDYSEIDEILDYRIIEDTYSDPDMRGGISPTRRP